MFSFPRTLSGSSNRVSRLDDPVVTYLNACYNNMRETAQHCTSTPYDLWYPIALAWDQLKQANPKLGMLQHTTLSRTMTTSVYTRIQAHKDMFNADYDTAKKNIDLTVVHAHPGGSEFDYVPTLIDKGWENKPRLATLLTLNRGCKVAVLSYRDQPQNLTAYMVIIQSDNMQTYARIAALLPSFVGMELAPEVQRILLLWAEAMLPDYVDTDFTLWRELNAFPDVHNYQERQRKQALQAFISTMHTQEIARAQNALADARTRVDRALAEYTTNLANFRVYQDKVFMAEINSQTLSKNLQDGFDYIERHKCVRTMFVRNNALWLQIVAPFVNFEEAAANAVIKHRMAYSPQLQQMFRILLEQDEWQLWMSANIQLPLNGSSVEVEPANDVSDACPNFHLIEYGCFGDNGPTIRQYASDNNLVGLVDVLVSSVSNINFRDTPVIRYFENYLECDTEVDKRGIRNKRTGECLTPEQWKRIIFPPKEEIQIETPAETIAADELQTAEPELVPIDTGFLERQVAHEANHNQQ